MKPGRDRFTPAERGTLTATMVGGAIVPLNSTMIAVALPEIAADTGVSTGTAALLVTAYLVAMLIFQPVGGRLGDRLGSKRVALAAMGVFACASVLGALAPTFAVLLAARCLQAVAGSSFSPNLQALTRSAIAPHRLGRALGLTGTGIGLGAAIGPVIGGLLVAAGSWRAVFLVNAPVIIPAMLLLSRLRVDARRHAGSASRTPLRKVLLQTRFVAACATQATGNFAMYTLLLLMPQLLTFAGLSSGPIGFAVSTLTIGMLILAPIGGHLGDSRGRRAMIVFGTSVAAAGFALVAVGVDTVALIVLGALVVGCGQGLYGASLQASALEAVPEETTASAAGFFSTSRYVGSIAGSLIIAAADAHDAASAQWVAVAALVGAAIAIAAGARAGTAQPARVASTATTS